MNYIYSPIYKYLLCVIIIYLFLYHQNIFTQQDLIVNSIIIVAVFLFLDYILIENNEPLILPEKKEKFIIIDDIFDDDDSDSESDNDSDSDNESNDSDDENDYFDDEDEENSKKKKKKTNKKNKGYPKEQKIKRKQITYDDYDYPPNYMQQPMEISPYNMNYYQ
jgi:hypothetical protein